MGLPKQTGIDEDGFYPFRSYPSVPCETVLFPGCAFSGQLPRTMDAFESLCRERGIGVAYDCCGQPLALRGPEYEPGAAKALAHIEGELAALGCKRVVTICPNCDAMLRERLSVPVITIYELFEELGLCAKGDFAEGVLFIPCPDAETHRMRDMIRADYDLSKVCDLSGVGCCGLKPKIAALGPEMKRRCAENVFKAAEGKRIYTYCASCAGQFTRNGKTDCRHVVSVLLGVDEQADCRESALNRLKRQRKGAAE